MPQFWRLVLACGVRTHERSRSKQGPVWDGRWQSGLHAQPSEQVPACLVPPSPLTPSQIRPRPVPFPTTHTLSGRTQKDKERRRREEAYAAESRNLAPDVTAATASALISRLPPLRLSLRVASCGRLPAMRAAPAAAPRRCGGRLVAASRRSFQGGDGDGRERRKEGDWEGGGKGAK
eukprot:364895-Chlamydomonas_euryale.AAC.2